jgi:uncharacterized protein YkwD
MGRTRNKHLNANSFSRKELAVFILVFAALGGYAVFRGLAASNPNLPGDLNNDNIVDAVDLSLLLSNFGTSNAAGNANTDNIVDAIDLSIVLSHFGQSYAPADTEIATEAECPNQTNNSVSLQQKYDSMTCMSNHARFFDGGLGPLGQDARLMSAASSKANDIITCNDFSHTACGRTFDYWIFNSGWTGNCWGENIAYGYPTVHDTFVAWMNSPPHRENILNGNYTDIGLGLQSGGSFPNTWVMELGGCH